jgi:ubiquinone/menaquinone biosynthesis C-methylase UbiE
MGATESMRQDWDARARKDAFFYIASWRKDWNRDDFLKSGEEDYERLVVPFLSRYGFSPEGQTMLELGCGAGRMTHSFATHFRRVIALDVSAEMLQRGQQMLQGMENVAWKHANGVDLSGVADESVDFAFSYLVLQHLPDERLVRTYVKEMFRVLRPSGICLFQFHGTRKATMNWKGRAAWAFLDALSRIGLRPTARLGARLLGLDPEMAGNNWHGIPVAAETIAQTVKDSNAQVLEVQGEDTPMVWCCASKLS